MANLRHLALWTRQPEKMAEFYTRVFEMKETFRTKNGSIHLSDGEVNLALLNANDPKDPNDKVRVGMNHFGFHIADQESTLQRIKEVYPASAPQQRPNGTNYAEARHGPRWQHVRSFDLGLERLHAARRQRRTGPMIPNTKVKSLRRARTSATLLLGVWIWVLVDVIAANPARGASAGEVLKKIQSLAPAQRRATLEEGAKSESQVVIYTSVSLSDYPKILAAFEQSYPYVKTNAFRSTPSGVVRRVDTEAKAGRHAVDIVATAPVETWHLRQLQLIAPYLSPERNALFKGAFEPEGYWTAFDVTPIVLAFNTKLVSQQEAPKNYQDLLLPKWKGKMSLGTEDYEWFGAVLDFMGKDKGLEYMRALAKQSLHMPGSSSVMRVQLLLGGESAIAIAARGRRVAEFKSKGAPIDFRIFDPYAAEPDMLALMQHSTHPHAAILFYDWLLSQDGQSKMSDLTGRIAVRKGVKHLPWLQELLQKDFLFITPAAKTLNTKEITDLYHGVFGLYGAQK